MILERGDHMGVQKQKIDRQKKESHDQKEGTINRTGMGDDHDRDHDQRNSKGKKGHEIHSVLLEQKDNQRGQHDVGQRQREENFSTRG